MAAEDFPALPGLSKSAKKRQKEKDKRGSGTLVGRMAAAAAPPRVLNVASSSGATSARAAAAAAGPSASASSGGLGGGLRHSASAGALPASEPVSGAASEDSDSPVAAVAGRAEAFPALGPAAGAPLPPAHPSWTPVQSRAPKPRSAASKVKPAAAAPQAKDFPSLAAALPAAAAASPSRARPLSRGGTSGASSAPAAPALSAADAVAAAGGVSDSLKSANRALVERIKAQLDDAGFQSFKQQSAGFMRGSVAASAYHGQVVALGLLPLVTDLAALCPESDKRASLLAAHKAFLSSEAAHDQCALGRSWMPPEAGLAAAARVEQQASWVCARCTLLNAPASARCEVCASPRPPHGPAPVPVQPPAPAQPSAAHASGGRVAAASSSASGGGQWASLARAGEPGSSTSSSSKAGASARPVAAESGAGFPGLRQEAAFPSLPGAPSSSRSSNTDAGPSSSAAANGGAAPSSSGGGKGKKGRPVKQSLHELMQSGKTHPGNAWTQQQGVSKIKSEAQQPAQASKGQWAKGGGAKLASNINLVYNDKH